MISVRAKFKSLRRKLLQSIHRGQQKLSIQLDLTNACNLSCAHCYHSHHKNIGALGYTDWLHVLDQYQDLLDEVGMSPEFTLCGGEPLLFKELSTLVAHINAKFHSPSITVLTNGTLVTPERVFFFDSLKTHFQVSLDGPTAESHDSVRGLGNFVRSLEGIAALKNLGYRVTSLAVLSKRNSTQLEEFFHLAQKIGLSEMNFTRFISAGTGAKLTSDGADRALSAIELKEAYTNILSLSDKYRVYTNSGKALFTLLNSSLGAHHRFGFQGLVVDYQGHLKVSSRAPIRLGHLFQDDSMTKLYLHHPLMKALRDPRKNACGSCQHFWKCGGDRNAAWAATGNFLEMDPACWHEHKQAAKKIAANF